MSSTIRRNSMMQKNNNRTEMPPLQAVAIMIDAYHLTDKRRSSPQTDYLEGFLLHDVPEWGMKAEFSEPANPEEPRIPLTRIKVMMPMKIDPATQRPKEEGNRRGIYGLSKTKGNGVAIDEGGIVVFEKAYFSKKNDTIIAPYAHGCANAAQLASGLKSMFMDMLVCVRPEDKIAEGTEKERWAKRVDVLIAEPKDAALVSSKAALQEFVNELVANNTIGNPGFQLLARQLAPEGVDPFQFASDPNTRLGGFSVARRLPVEVEGQEKQWIPETADELMVRFARENPDFDQLVGDSGWQIEFVPMMAVNQAKSLVPSLAEVKPGSTLPPRDNSTVYGIFGQVPDGPDGAHARDKLTDANGTTWGQIDSGWIRSQCVCERKEADTDIWYSTYQTPMGKKLDADSIHDVRTKFTPDYHLAAINNEAAHNLVGFKAHQALKNPRNVEAPEPDQDAPAPGL